MVSLASLSAFSQSAARRPASPHPTPVAARDAAPRSVPFGGSSAAAPPLASGKPVPRGSLLNLSV